MTSLKRMRPDCDVPRAINQQVDVGVLTGIMPCDRPEHRATGAIMLIGQRLEDWRPCLRSSGPPGGPDVVLDQGGNAAVRGLGGDLQEPDRVPWRTPVVRGVAAARKPVLPVVLSGVLAVRAATR